MEKVQVLEFKKIGDVICNRYLDRDTKVRCANAATGAVFLNGNRLGEFCSEHTGTVVEMLTTSGDAVLEEPTVDPDQGNPPADVIIR